MSKRQTQKMLQLMASGEPVQLTSRMSSVKKLAKLAFVAQQFGYEYADVRQSGGNNTALTMLLLPDPNPQARTRAAQNWAQYPNAGDGVSLPPLVPDAFELLKARIKFDLTGKNAQKNMGYGALGGTVACVVIAFREGGSSDDFLISGIIWLVLMAALGIGFLATRKRNAKFAARLQAAGFMPMTDETGRVRYLPPGGQLPGHGNPFGTAPGGYAQPAPGPYGAQPPQQPYPQQPYAQPQQAPQAQQPYAPPQGQQPYPPQQAPQPYAQPQGYPQQNPHWQPQPPQG
ncbi:XdhC/CoxF family protein [Streptomyces sp. SID10362]|uniref:XdhC/CoxF family protein n=1 Tax=Streptomyces sp. SID10362 TaxID=2706021 RepID=UPI0013CCEE14|nr:XdhC/CoxF family protein [Streptomyces sp. SID10362]NDZ70264.1 XdhC/CoxF family protein [Streptomyces sp. SID10362]